MGDIVATQLTTLWLLKDYAVCPATVAGCARELGQVSIPADISGVNPRAGRLFAPCFSIPLSLSEGRW